MSSRTTPWKALVTTNCLIVGFPVLLVSGGCQLPPSSIWSDAVRNEDCTANSDLLGKVDDSAYPLVFSSTFGETMMIWTQGAARMSDQGGFFAWRYATQDWIWTAEDYLGWFYSYRLQDWVWTTVDYLGWFYSTREGWQTFASDTAVYYVDFDEGDDMNNGLAPISAWKHAPGDPNADATPAQAVLHPGDRVLLKGGVVYRGNLIIDAVGSSENPIVYKGDAWGTGKAIIDGSEPFVSSWSQCDGPDCLDSAFADRIYFTNAPQGLDFLSGFFEDNQLLWYSQGPNPADPMVYDNTSNYLPIPLHNQTANSLKDPDFFDQDDSDYWNDAYIVTWVTSNIVDAKQVTSFDPASDTIYYETLQNEPYSDRNGRYAMMNHVSLIDRPGEYALVNDMFYVYGDPSSHTYSYQVRNEGIRAENAEHLVIEGFVVRKFQYGIQVYESDDVIVTDNDVRTLRARNRYAIHVGNNSQNVVLDSNTVLNAQRAVGILLGGGVNNVEVVNNHVERSTRQGIWVFGVNKGLVARNSVKNINGIHSNGISVYESNKDILIAHNRVEGTQRALTYYRNGSSPLNLTVFCNFFDSECIGYDYETRGVNIINNFCSSAFSIRGSNHHDDSAINNIFFKGAYSLDIRTNNIFTYVVDTSTLYDSSYHLVEGSAAIDAGLDVWDYLPTEIFPDYDFTVDLDGNKRDEIWDIGPFEYIMK